MVENPVSRKFQIDQAAGLDGQTARDQLRNARAAHAEFSGKLGFVDQDGHGIAFKLE
jgi:hypothetical protein